MALFTSPFAVLAGWVHYLAFELFVGAWEVRDARRRNVPHLLVVPCLALTLMLGPAGLMSYLMLRFACTRTWMFEESAQVSHHRNGALPDYRLTGVVSIHRIRHPI